MKTYPNIDELLKDQFSGFSPEAPDVWSGIEQNLPDVSQAAHTASTVGTTVKAGLSVTKVLLSVAAAAMVGTGIYYAIPSTEKEPVAKEQPAIVQENNISSPVEPVAEPPQLPEKKGETVETTPSKTGHTKVSEIMHHDLKLADPSSHVHANTDGKKETSDRADVLASAPQNNNKEQANTEPAASRNDNVRKAENQPEKKGPENKNNALTTSPNETPSLDNKPEEAEIFIPNVVTPDGDGKNDRFVIPVENEVMYDLKITDKAGNVLFESRDKNVTWDGTNTRTGSVCPEGSYVYAFRYQLRSSKEPKFRQGLINIIR